ncbi:MAG: hypothetical protein WD080_04325 [Egibacteraceae bacterium]
MAAELGTSLMAGLLVLAFPMALLLGLWFLGRLEDWMLRPYERAIAIESVLAAEEEAEAVERAVIDMIADVADSPQRRSARQTFRESIR